MNILYKHAHLIINNSEEILDGSLLIINNKIEKVSYKEIEVEDVKTIDLNGAYILPAPISFKGNNQEIIISDDDKLIKDNKVIGFNDFFNKFDSLTYNNESNVNKAFADEEMYVILNDVLEKPKEILNVIFKTKLKDRIVIDDFNESLVKYLKEKFNLKLTDIVSFIAINPSKLVGINNTNGSLTKGKSANLLILDKDLNKMEVK